MPLSPYQMAQRYWRSRDWHLVQAARQRRMMRPIEVLLHEGEVGRIDGYLAALGFASRPPDGPTIGRRA